MNKRTRAPIERHIFSARQAATFLGISPETVLQALRATDPAAYPPPLEHLGRHGEGGRYAITREQCVAWAESLSRFG